MNRIVLVIVMVCCLVAPSMVWAESAEDAYQVARKSYYDLQNSSRKQMYRENWERVYNKFEAVHKKFPDTQRGADALYMCGKTTAELYEISRVKDDAEKAVILYEQMAEIYPENSLSDDALMQAGELLEEVLGKKTEAYLLYRRLVDVLPPGDMASRAKGRLKSLAAYAPKEQPGVEASAVAKASPVQPVTSTDGKGRLTAIRHWSNPGYTRIVLDVSREARFSANYLAPDPKENAPPRIYVDIEQSELDDGLKDPKVVDDGLLQRIRTGQPKSDTVRVVLDLESIGDYKVFPLGDPWRIVIDIAGDKSPQLSRGEAEIKSLPESGADAIARVLDEKPEVREPKFLPKASSSSMLRRIVVDAGHGGKDPGAVGPTGVLEKDVTLKLAHALARELTRQIGCEVILTRTGDVYLPLEERTAIANKVGADLFISLHANANKSRKPFGIETYYLNFSKNDKAAAVAARENGTSLKEVSDLELILFDLMANAKINESSRLATEIQKTLVKSISKTYSNVRDLGVRQGPFYVLLGATMPSVLVETAFISNHREEKRLASSKYRKSAATAIASAIKTYAVNNNLIASR